VNVINNTGTLPILHNAVMVPPVFEEKWQLRTDIYKVKLPVSQTIFHDPANPVLPEQKKVKFQADDIVFLTAIKTQQFDRGEGGIEFEKEVLSKPPHYGTVILLNSRRNIKSHSFLIIKSTLKH
jgi:hypothetical protein